MKYQTGHVVLKTKPSKEKGQLHICECGNYSKTLYTLSVNHHQIDLCPTCISQISSVLSKRDKSFPGF
jgi:hypothetical protein